MGTPFSEHWQPNPELLDRKMRRRLLAGTALTAIVTGGALLTRAITPDFLLLMTPAILMFSAADLWSRKTTAPVDIKSEKQLSPHPEYQETVENLMAKCDLKIKADVQLYTGHARKNIPQIPQVRPGFDTHDWRIQVLPYKDDSGLERALIIIGHKLAEHMTTEEITAQVGHEIGHLMSPRQQLSGATIFKHKFIPWMIGGALAHASPLAALGYVATYFNHYAGLLKIARMNEYKADRNSVALYPHRNALLNGLALVEVYHELMQRQETFVGHWLRKMQSEHGDKDVRNDIIIRHLAEAQNFYARHNITDGVDEILPVTDKNHILNDQQIDCKNPRAEWARLVDVAPERKSALLKDLKRELNANLQYRNAIAKMMQERSGPS